MFLDCMELGDRIELLSVERVKRALQIYDNNDDLEIESLIYTAFEIAETYCKQKFITCLFTAERYDNVKEFYVPNGRASLKPLLLLDGEVVEDYTYHEIAQKIIVPRDYNVLRMEYQSNVIILPPAVERGIIFLISTLLNSGADFTTTQVHELPITATRLLDTHRRLMS